MLTLCHRTINLPNSVVVFEVVADGGVVLDSIILKGVSYVIITMLVN